jgi:hypothetical protein
MKNWKEIMIGISQEIVEDCCEMPNLAQGERKEESLRTLQV